MKHSIYFSILFFIFFIQSTLASNIYRIETKLKSGWQYLIESNEKDAKNMFEISQMMDRKCIKAKYGIELIKSFNKDKIKFNKKNIHDWLKRIRKKDDLKISHNLGFSEEERQLYLTEILDNTPIRCIERRYSVIKSAKEKDSKNVDSLYELMGAMNCSENYINEVKKIASNIINPPEPTVGEAKGVTDTGGSTGFTDTSGGQVKKIASNIINPPEPTVGEAKGVTDTGETKGVTDTGETKGVTDTSGGHVGSKKTKKCDCKEEYTIKIGDNLNLIAIKFYGNYSDTNTDAIKECNSNIIHDKGKIYYGDKICIPK